MSGEAELLIHMFSKKMHLGVHCGSREASGSAERIHFLLGPQGTGGGSRPGGDGGFSFTRATALVPSGVRLVGLQGVLHRVGRTQGRFQRTQFTGSSSSRQHLCGRAAGEMGHSSGWGQLLPGLFHLTT